MKTLRKLFKRFNNENQLIILKRNKSNKPFKTHSNLELLVQFPDGRRTYIRESEFETINLKLWKERAKNAVKKIIQNEK